MAPITITGHDDVPRSDGAIVDAGLCGFNDAAAPLHEVRPMACFARTPDGAVIGGAVGRTWGPAAEIQQLWVADAHRHRGVGTALVRAFEARAAERGCRSCYLETLSFQAPRFYAALGYRVVFELRELPYGIVRFTMLRELGPDAAGR
ncbi:MAG: GNAT family N-acetyltransferase [Burkholderiales bacterium]